MKRAMAAALLILAFGGQASASVIMSLNLDVNSAADGTGTDYGTIVGTITFDDTLTSMTQYDITYTPSAKSAAPAFTFDGYINAGGIYEDGSYTQSYTYSSQVQPYTEFFFQYVDSVNSNDRFNYTLSLATLPGVILADGVNTFTRIGAADEVQFQYQSGIGSTNIQTTFGDVLGTLTAVPEPSSWLLSSSAVASLLASTAWTRRKRRVQAGVSRA
jgi:hypothetical protein